MDHSFFPTRWTMLAGLICIAFAPLGTTGDSWPGFCGDGSGIAKADLPTQWSAEQGVAW